MPAALLPQQSLTSNANGRTTDPALAKSSAGIGTPLTEAHRSPALLSSGFFYVRLTSLWWAVRGALGRAVSLVAVVPTRSARHPYEIGTSLVAANNATKDSTMTNHHACAPSASMLSAIHDQFGQLTTLLECIEHLAEDDTDYPNPRAAQLARIGQSVTLLWHELTEQYKDMKECRDE